MIKIEQFLGLAEINPKVFNEIAIGPFPIFPRVDFFDGSSEEKRVFWNIARRHCRSERRAAAMRAWKRREESGRGSRAAARGEREDGSSDGRW